MTPKLPQKALRPATWKGSLSVSHVSPHWQLCSESPRLEASARLPREESREPPSSEPAASEVECWYVRSNGEIRGVHEAWNQSAGCSTSAIASALVHVNGCSFPEMNDCSFGSLEEPMSKEGP